MFIFGIIFTVGSGYIAADTALTITNYFRSSPASSLNNNWLFVLTIIWPAAASAIYFIIQAGVVIRVLREKKPLCAFSPPFAFVPSTTASPPYMSSETNASRSAGIAQSPSSAPRSPSSPRRRSTTRSGTRSAPAPMARSTVAGSRLCSRRSRSG